MSNFQKLSLGVSRQAPIQGTDIASGSATNGQVLTADGSGGASWQPLSLPTIYDEVQAIATTITAGTAVTLPASGSYIGDELEIYLNGQYLTFDSNGWQTSGGGPTYTAVTFAGNLVNGDVLHWRKVRNQ